MPAPGRARLRLALAALLLAGVPLASAPAQHLHDGLPAHGEPRGMHLSAQAVPLVTRASPVPGGGTRTEWSLTQAIVMGRAAWWAGRAALDVTLDFEGLTMPGGELSLGAFGEGYVDRRHPHTYLHELVGTLQGAVGPVRLSASAGRGFAPFGTDDPMVRPFAKYPVNHHLAQVLERGLAMGAARLGPLILEGGSFTGEEPERPSSLPSLARFGDSWSVRATLLPARWAELQGSYARLASPEQADGFGLDQRKQSISARVATPGAGRYALAEWGRTVEHDHSRRVDVHGIETALLEAGARLGRGRIALRVEGTERPEEERAEDPFRGARPHTDLHILGITRWRTATLHLAAPAVTAGMVAGAPFLEISRLAATARDERAIFRPDAFYGASRFWMATAGVRLQAGAVHARMGRYGVARPE